MSKLKDQVIDIARRARAASRRLAAADGRAKDRALTVLAGLLESRREAIAAANAEDIAAAEARKLEAPKINRLRITDKVLAGMGNGCREVAAMADPVGGMDQAIKRPNGMLVARMRVPLGVVAMIYESRPNATIEAAILCLKAGDAVILRGGSEAIHSNLALAGLLAEALREAGLPEDAVQVVPFTDRDAVAQLLKLDQYIDVVIPRGGEGLIRAVTEQAAMPVLKHYKGVCHIYADQGCDVEAAVAIIHNAKTQYPSACNALECLLVHASAAEALLPRVAERLGADRVVFKACPRSLPLLGKYAEPAEASD
ncbi:MAG: glutamate-5-semialdehyde dehydrogenase, partial [Desulfovibrionaceae bacterium]